MINKELIKKFTTEFPKRYLTLNKLKKLSKRDRWFHFNGHWNIIRIEDNYLIHSYVDGGNGDIGKEFSRIKLTDLDKTVFCKWDNVFLLFNFSEKKGLRPIYLSDKISTFGRIKPVHIFYRDNGILVKKEVLNMNMKSIKPYVYFDAFTGEEL